MVFLIWFASVASGLKFVFGLLAFFFLFSSSIGLIEGFDSDTESPKKFKILGFISLALCILSTFICVIIPSEENIYKIAGMIAQQKAQIDTSGEVVK